jgi:hypothetical protein
MWKHKVYNKLTQVWKSSGWFQNLEELFLQNEVWYWMLRYMYVLILKPERMWVGSYAIFLFCFHLRTSKTVLFRQWDGGTICHSYIHSKCFNDCLPTAKHYSKRYFVKNVLGMVLLQTSFSSYERSPQYAYILSHGAHSVGMYWIQILWKWHCGKEKRASSRPSGKIADELSYLFHCWDKNNLRKEEFTCPPYLRTCVSHHSREGMGTSAWGS